MKIKTLLFTLCAVGALSACTTVDGVFGEIDPQISAVELEALQTREYEADYTQAFAATIGAFQSYGYVVQSADRETGLVIAKTTSDAGINYMTGLTRVEYDKATAFLEQVAPGRVKIRVSIVKYVSAKSAYGGGGEKEAMRTRPEVYQNIFGKIDQALFLKKNL